MAWTTAVPVRDLPDGAAVAWEHGGHHLALWRGGSGAVVACDARCPHQWADLAVEGRVIGDELVCAAHGWRFDTSGEGWKDSATGRRDRKAPVQTHPCRVRAGWVEVDLPSPG